MLVLVLRGKLMNHKQDLSTSSSTTKPLCVPVQLVYTFCGDGEGLIVAKYPTRPA